jgi:uncharacterized protein
VRFWDSSAIVPLLVTEVTSRAVTGTFEADPDVIAWWATHVECVSALARLERDASLPRASMSIALRRLDGLAAAWHEIEPGTSVRQLAVRLLRVHPLRTADAFQLAAAIVAADGQPATLPFVTLDDRLAHAAEREGFPIVRPAEA